MTGWPADRVERRPVAELIPYARNARTHSDAQVAQIAGSIREWGWTTPVLIDENNTIVAGHGRILAAHLLKLDDVPVIVARGWSEAQRRAYVIADNKLALNAGWDDAMLAVEVRDLVASSFDMSTVGFSAEELVALTADRSEGLTDPDDVPEEQAVAISRTGDVWLLGAAAGGHRLVCGDATDGAAVAQALGGAQPKLMVTDPPYGVNYDPSWRHRRGVSNSKRIGKVENDDRADWRDAWALFPGSVAYVWHGALRASEMQAGLEAAGFQIRAQIIWAKSRLVLGRGHYHWQHEPCWYAVRGSGEWAGDRAQTTLWQISNKNQDVETVHGTQKPVECMQRAIENSSKPGDAVYEPFSGSGTTIIAAEMTRRTCHAIELQATYVDMAIRRWQAFTGKSAVLEADGTSFADAEATRSAIPA